MHISIKAEEYKKAAEDEYSEYRQIIDEADVAEMMVICRWCTTDG